ncbi:sigma-70 family RNA polymerase sigma factor [Nocardioides humi]|uniref:Sigma-70 family RNA polymerase sigma factor n=1 Tax=Nocardioides humi TaxID=449461 RepID=A0ABN2BV15_9ACTN|nr:sigma-70 family RNA polymerase sigma factor [Nocardioides humi]
MSLPIPSTTAGPGAPASHEPALASFLALRPHLFRIAYRVTGDACGADDVVQEAWLRWQRTDLEAIRNPAAFLTTTTTRLAINVIQSARHRHEVAMDAPVSEVPDGTQDLTLGVEQAGDVADSLWLLMARLSPAELAAYLLRKCFDYSYHDIADLLGTSSPNARQLVHRAQPRIRTGRDRPVDRLAHRRLTTAFAAAAGGRGLDDLERLLCQGTWQRNTAQQEQSRAA